MRDRDVPQGLLYGFMVGALFFAAGGWQSALTGSAVGALVGFLPTMRHPHKQLAESPMHVGLLMGSLVGLLTGVLTGSLNVALVFFVIGILSGALTLLTARGR